MRRFGQYNIFKPITPSPVALACVSFKAIILMLFTLWESVIVLLFCCMLLYVHFCIAIILMGIRELVALLNLSSWCLVMVERLFLTVPRGCLRFVIVVFPDHTHLLFLVVAPIEYVECVSVFVCWILVL